MIVVFKMKMFGIYDTQATPGHRRELLLPRAMDFEGAAVSVHYKDRMSEIRLNLAGNIAHHDQEVVSLALNLQAALNLATPPVGLRLRVAPGTEAVVCPLSVLVACPSYIATTFQGECGLLCALSSALFQVHIRLIVDFLHGERGKGVPWPLCRLCR